MRVGGPEGERAYLARLRCADGASPRIGSREDAGVDAFGTVARAYSARLRRRGSRGERIVFDIYHEEHVEDRAPPGFTIQDALEETQGRHFVGFQLEPEDFRQRRGDTLRHCRSRALRSGPSG